jgi:hypothetical protein
MWLTILHRHPETDFAPPNVARTNSTRPGWGADELSKFLQETHQQQYATFHNKKEAVGRLVAIDDLFVRVSKGWVNPASEIEAMLFLPCHSAFRAATGEAMAGQVVESRMKGARSHHGLDALSGVKSIATYGTSARRGGPPQADCRICTVGASNAEANQ